MCDDSINGSVDVGVDGGLGGGGSHGVMGFDRSHWDRGALVAPVETLRSKGFGCCVIMIYLTGGNQRASFVSHNRREFAGVK